MRARSFMDVNCECPASSSIGKCCTNIAHFSDFLLVTEAPPQPIWTRYLWVVGLLILAVTIYWSRFYYVRRRRPDPDNI